MSNKPYRLGAHALIFDQGGNVLLTQHQSYQANEWNFPGGGREEGEDAKDNALREVNEELGFTKDDLQFIAVSSHANMYDFPAGMISKDNPITQIYRGQQKDHVLFRFVGEKDTIKLDLRELKQYKWVPLDQLDKYLIFANQYQGIVPVIEEYRNLTK